MKAFLKLLVSVLAVWGLIFGVQQLPYFTMQKSAERVHFADGDFLFVDTNDDGSPVTWDTCKPIDVLVETIGMPADADKEIEQAVNNLVEATDLKLNYLGTVSGLHSPDWVAESESHYPDQVPILIGWSPLDADMPSEVTVGFASTMYRSRYAKRQIAGSVITIHTKRLGRLTPGFPVGNSRGAVYMHEIAHAVGLDHVPNQYQLMYEAMTSYNGRLTEGDIDGLNALAAHMCTKGK